MQAKEQITINGDGEQTRDFVFVSDIAETCLKSIESEVKNEIINVSTSKAISINKLVEIMAQKFNYKKAPAHAQERVGDIKHSILDNKKCLKLLEWHLKPRLKTGLAN